MKGVCRWTIAGLLCLCGVFGCAQLPSRGLFARRIKPPTDESRAEDRSDLTDDESAGVSVDDNSHRNLFAESRQDRDLDADNSTNSASLVIEAPSPNRRSSVPPATFVVPPNAREIASNSTTNVSNSSLDPSAIVLANHESTARENPSGIELTAGQRSANPRSASALNPWDRFRGLTNNLDANDPATQSPPKSGSPGDRRIEGDRDQTLGRPNIDQPPPWSESFSRSVTNNGFNNTVNNPDPWPRGPGNWNTAAGAPTGASPAPSNMQRVSAEQPGSINFPPAAPNPQMPASTGNLPLNFGAPLAIAPFASSQELERLITQTTVEAAAVIPGDNEVSRQLFLRKHVQLRLLQLIAGQMDRALQPIPGIDSADQEFWQQMLWGMANYFDTQGMPDSSERATQTINQLRIAATKLQEKARLELRNVAFCLKISGFGNYQRFKRDEFMTGQAVLLYAEVADFKSEPTSDGQFRTLMKSTLEIFEGGPNGRLVESLPLTPSEDRCRNQRRDYYHSYEFAIPQGCSPGPHTLRLRVEDQLGKKTAITSLNFTVQ